MIMQDLQTLNKKKHTNKFLERLVGIHRLGLANMWIHSSATISVDLCE
jgi:hypothetical protein